MDLVSKRNGIAEKGIIYATQLVDALNGLKNLREERQKLGADFQDSDFVGTDLAHVSAGQLGTLFDFVVPSLDANYQDVANGERNKQILLQVRK